MSELNCESVPSGPPAPARVRSNAWAMLLVCGAMVGLSFWVQPDPRGYGTHSRLILLPCFFRVATGLPCPFCGMTTGFAEMARGQATAAFRHNVMAPPGFVLAILTALVGLWGLLTGRDWLPARGRNPVLWPRVALVIIGLGWVVNLTRHFLTR